jgi:hypothetical protein
MKRFKLKSAGTKTIDILPFRVGKGNPFAKEGEVHYERTFHVHKSLGPNEDSYVCPAKTSGEKCPVCEYRAKLARNPDADEDLVKSLRPSERQLFLVIDHADREAGPQLWDVSYHLFGKVLDSVLKNSDEDDGFDLFYHLTKGLSLKLMVVEKSMGKGKPFALVESVLFKQRKEQYSADMLDELPCLDDLLVIKPYKELQAILMHTEADEASDEDAPPPKKAKKALPADDDSDEDDEDAPPPKKAKKAAPADDDDDDDDDDDSPPPPAKKSKTMTMMPTTPLRPSRPRKRHLPTTMTTMTLRRLLRRASPRPPPIAGMTTMTTRRPQLRPRRPRLRLMTTTMTTRPRRLRSPRRPLRLRMTTMTMTLRLLRPRSPRPRRLTTMTTTMLPRLLRRARASRPRTTTGTTTSKTSQ